MVQALGFRDIGDYIGDYYIGVVKGGIRSLDHGSDKGYWGVRVEGLVFRLEVWGFRIKA